MPAFGLAYLFREDELFTIYDIPDNVVVVQGKESTYRILCSYDEYVEKNKQKINNLPVSNILFEQRSSEQQEDWRNLLGSHGGYDL